MAIGPVEYMIVAFPGNKFKGEIAPAPAELIDSQTIRLIDLAFVIKDEDGNVATLEVGDLDSEVGAAFAELAGQGPGGLLNQEDLGGWQLGPRPSPARPRRYPGVWPGVSSRSTRDKRQSSRPRPPHLRPSMRTTPCFRFRSSPNCTRRAPSPTKSSPPPRPRSSGSSRSPAVRGPTRARAGHDQAYGASGPSACPAPWQRVHLP